MKRPAKKKNKSTNQPSKKSGAEKRLKRNSLELSIIIPAFNLGQDLSRCLDSVLAQENVEFEVIVVDDCSTDNTLSIIRRYAEKDKRIVPICLAKNSGPSAARNAALDLAKGEYIHFCDGDDSVIDGAYAELLRVAYEEDSDIVTANYSRRYPSEHNVIRPFSNYQAPTGIERCFESGNTTLWNKIYRREFIGKQRFNVSLRYYEDYLFFYQLIKKNPNVSYTDEFVYVYTDPYQQVSSDYYTNKIRNANMDVIHGVCVVWRVLFSEEPSEHIKLWQYAYCWNLSWYYQWSWILLQDVSERKQAFEMLRELLMWVQEHIDFCDWNEENHMDQFIEIFHVDYQTFCSISFEDYLMRLALHNNVCPRAATHAFRRKFGMLSEAVRDEKITEDIRAQLDELREIYQKEFKNRRLWASHYWSVLDGIMNDYWRLLVSENKKEACFSEIKVCMAELWEKNALCRFNHPDDIWRFQSIFGIDYAMFQTFTMSQYLLVCSFRVQRTAGSNLNCQTISGAVDINSIAGAFESGNVGMKGILRALKGWLKFKLKRKRT